jgi:hypothetical protein
MILLIIKIIFFQETRIVGMGNSKQDPFSTIVQSGNVWIINIDGNPNATWCSWKSGRP